MESTDGLNEWKGYNWKALIGWKVKMKFVFGKGKTKEKTLTFQPFCEAGLCQTLIPPWAAQEVLPVLKVASDTVWSTLSRGLMSLTALFNI